MAIAIIIVLLVLILVAVGGRDVGEFVGNIIGTGLGLVLIVAVLGIVALGIFLALRATH